MVDEQTIALYDAKAQDYADLVTSAEPDAQMLAFMAMLPAGGSVLDLGCGPGSASTHLARAGFDPMPVDASAGMVALARDKYGLPAQQMTFDDINMVDRFDGVWANFSLLHAARGDLPRHLSALSRALKSGGAFHIGMKLGTGAQRDRINRMYTYVTKAELRNLLHAANLTVTCIDMGEDTGFAGTVEPWIVMRARKDG